MAAWRSVVLTIFPEMFPGPLGQSLAGKALERELWALDVLDIDRVEGAMALLESGAPVQGPTLVGGRCLGCGLG